MKRRNFIVSAASVIGSLGLPAVSRAQRPCPPPRLSVDSATPVETSCNVDEFTDWQNRISGPGVVWYHNFESPAEVAAFRWAAGYGNDPNDEDVPGILSWRGDDGFAGGGCMERIRRVGTTENAVEWWRPFSPFAAPGNGRTTDDPGANGTIPLRTWAPTPGGSQTERYPDRGYYGDPSYHTGDVFDGTEYWLQVRVKMDPNRAAPNNRFNGGKLFYFTRTDRSLTAQEIVTTSGYVHDGGGTYFNGRNYFQMYRSGSPPLYSDPPGAGVHGHQPGNLTGTVSDGLCRLDNSGGRLANCWAWPAGEWVTLLYHVRPGRHNNSDTLVEVYAARRGATEYSRIWYQENVNLSYDSSKPFGHNALICSGFMNGRDVGTQFYHRWTQIIFSKAFIPCPAV